MRNGPILLGLFAACLAGCSSDRSTAPSGTVLTDAQISADIAVSSGSAAASMMLDEFEYLDAMRGPSADLLPPIVREQPRADAAAPVAIPLSSCSYNAAAGRWACEPFVNSRGMTVVRSFAYFNAAGGVMQRYDPVLTARVNYQTSMVGTVGDGATFAGVSHRSSNQTMSGLAGHETTRIWDGAGVSADTTTHHDSLGARKYAGARLDSLKGMTFIFPRTPGTYPLAGQAVQVANFTVTATGHTNEMRSVSRRVVTTFNGTADVAVTSGSVTCRLNLDTRIVSRCTRG